MSNQQLSLVDTHGHLHRAEFDSDRQEVLARAKQAGLSAIIDPATDWASNPVVADLALRFPEVYAAVGIHPHHATELTPERLMELTSLATQAKVVAIGEIGLDYHRNLSPPEVQQEALRKLLRLAHELSKPVILHCRDEAGSAQAYQDLFGILKESLQPPIRGVLHCFTANAEIAAQALDLGLYLSFAGNLTFPKAEALRQVAKEIPFDKVLLETDAPFLAPSKYRGQRNEPAYLTELVEAWAKIQDLTAEDVARVTTVNAHQLFGIGPGPQPGEIAYAIRRSLYINLTNACTDRCVFCALSTQDFWKGQGSAPLVKGHHLRIPRDPTIEETLQAVGDPCAFEEVVFCGYGEPIIRLKELLATARELKAKGARWIRLNTNGHGNLIHKRSIAGDLKGIVDEVSVSLNTPTAEQYLEICRPAFGLATFEAIKAFIRECRDVGLKVVATAVGMPGIDVEACRRIATEELKVAFRVRTYNDLG